MEGTAPIYDSGTSLWQMTLTRAICAEAMVPAKPFETSQQSQLKLIALMWICRWSALMDFQIK